MNKITPNAPNVPTETPAPSRGDSQTDTPRGANSPLTKIAFEASWMNSTGDVITGKAIPLFMAWELEEHIATQSARLAALTEALEGAKKKQPINTHRRLFDLVRHMRAKLHEGDLINDDEYAWLCTYTFPGDPKHGSPSPRRLEDYDDIQAQLAQLKADNQRLARERDEAKEQWRMSSVCRELQTQLESDRMHHQESLDRLRAQRDELEVQLAQLTQHDKGGAPNAS